MSTGQPLHVARPADQHPGEPDDLEFGQGGVGPAEQEPRSCATLQDFVQKKRGTKGGQDRHRRESRRSGRFAARRHLRVGGQGRQRQRHQSVESAAAILHGKQLLSGNYLQP